MNEKIRQFFLALKAVESDNGEKIGKIKEGAAVVMESIAGYAKMTLASLVLAFLLTGAAVLCVFFGLTAWANVGAIAAFVALFSAYALVGFAGEALICAFLIVMLTKSIAIDAPVSLGEHLIFEVRKAIHFAGVRIENVVKAFAAFLPWVKAENLESAFHERSFREKEPDPIFSSLKKEVDRIIIRAQKYVQAIGIFFRTVLGFLGLFVVLNSFFRPNNLPDPAHWLNRPEVTLLLLVLLPVLVYGLVRKGWSAYFAGMSVIAAVCLCLAIIGYNATSSTEAKMRSRIEQYEGKIIHDELSRPTLVALREHVALSDKSQPIDSLIIDKGTEWELLNDSVVIAGDRLVKIRRGYGNQRVETFAYPEWFEVKKGSGTIRGNFDWPPKVDSRQFISQDSISPKEKELRDSLNSVRLELSALIKDSQRKIEFNERSKNSPTSSPGLKEVSKSLPVTSQEKAREIMGKSFLGIEEIKKCFNVVFSERDLQVLGDIPFSENTLEECKDLYILVADFGISILDIREMHPGLFSSEKPWFFNETFSHKRDRPSWRLVMNVLIPGSTEKTWKEQQGLINPHDEIPEARVMTYAMVSWYLVTQKKMFEGYILRTSSLTLEGTHAVVGRRDSSGLLQFSFRTPYASDCDHLEFVEFLSVASARRPDKTIRFP